jgi:hypothetical protein
MSSEDFKIVATEYAAMCNEITRVSAALRDMKKKKDELGDTILSIMRQKDLDECQLSNGGKIVRKTSKRTSTLKPDMILDEFKTVLNDDAKAEQSLQNIQSKREVVEKETITFSAPRGARAPVDDTDDI